MAARASETQKSAKKDYINTVGRRREASARVRLYRGKDENLVNGQVIGKYFPGKVMATKWKKPFELTGTFGKYYITAKVAGGGNSGQLDAVVHATSKAFSALDPEKFRTPLKNAVLLSRDSRVRERRMVGTGGRARKQKQSPKR